MAEGHSSNSLSVVVVSPARQLYQGDAAWVTAPAVDAGPLRIGLGGGGVERYAVKGGFLKVGANRVTILVDRAVTESAVNAAEAERELEQTKAELQHPETDEEFA